MAAAFFDRLPVQLTRAEEELREHLVRAARIAAELLPPGNVVSLQEWVECRMPGEVDLATDDAGLVTLRPARSPQQKVPDPVLQSFMSRLPADHFAPEEEALREAIVRVVERGPSLLAQVKRDSGVSRAMKVLLPPSIALEDWIERRIGGEVAVDSDERGQRVCRMMNGTVKEDHGRRRSDDFFKNLPKDCFTQGEERLRLAILDFLAEWSAKELATLSQCQNNVKVQQAVRYALDGGVGLKDWIEKRIGGELTLQPAPDGQLEIHLTAKARPAIAERVQFLQSQRGFPPPHMPGMPPPMPMPMPMVPGRPLPPPMAPWPVGKPQEREKPKARERKDPPEGKKAFWESLPAEELLPKELELRQLLLDELDRFNRGGGSGEGPMLSSIANNKACQRLKNDLFKKEVSFRDWIDRRIGGEIATKTASNGQVIILLRNGDQADAQEPEIDEPMEGAEISSEAQAFFDDLPPDGFLESEEALRETILSFLDSWGQDEPPTLRDAQQIPEIRDARDACLSGSSGVTLKMWIDRRIGGEIATWRKGGRAPDVSIGLREIWGEEASAANVEEVEHAKAADFDQVKRRKVDEGGRDRRGMAKGRGR
ncbi:unnamed protein product [Symbiodinium natans]|uniref:Uncharacterized protein n=1 Tax=Symbiodinium natans TaxID=878477 RepID=A0A812UMX3_9DINO|nr:unnamed protein product [Symbiodinium natans]